MNVAGCANDWRAKNEKLNLSGNAVLLVTLVSGLTICALK